MGDDGFGEPVERSKLVALEALGVQQHPAVVHLHLDEAVRRGEQVDHLCVEEDVCEPPVLARDVEGAVELLGLELEVAESDHRGRLAHDAFLCQRELRPHPSDLGRRAGAAVVGAMGRSLVVLVLVVPPVVENADRLRRIGSPHITFCVPRPSPFRKRSNGGPPQSNGSAGENDKPERTRRGRERSVTVALSDEHGEAHEAGHDAGRADQDRHEHGSLSAGIGVAVRTSGGEDSEAEGEDHQGDEQHGHDLEVVGDVRPCALHHRLARPPVALNRRR